MTREDSRSRFDACLLQPELYGEGGDWAFIVLPRDASARLPRRGRITVEGTLDGQPFQALLEPDGQKGHWLKVEAPLLKASGVEIGATARFEIMAVEQEPEPYIPPDLEKALQGDPKARSTWEATTAVARLDWIHWISSAKQATTRSKRIRDACEMLASGKKRVCCFDPSGFYSKAFSAPKAV